ncbi:MAG: FAD-dependent oxidoreductase [Ferruginibacter sp.]
MGYNIAMVGAGISGMSTAYLLKNQGHKVTIYASNFSPDITSNKAAAFWFPYHIRNDNRGIEWCHTTYKYYLHFAEDPNTGISLRQLHKILREQVAEEEPIWRDFMPADSVRMMDSDELQPGVAKGYDITVPLIETQLFLPWLMQQLQQKGVAFILKKIADFDELSSSYDIIINCSALGARELCKDDQVIPVRGQVALIAPGDDLTIYLDNEKPLYVVPRKDAIIIGGTYEMDEEHAITKPETINRLLKTAYEVFPQLAQHQVLGSWAGLRPYRNEVRVEREAGKNIIHNYGHGGSGFTLAFGCAETVCKILQQEF